MTDADGLKARLAAMRERQARAEHDRKFEQFARSVPILCALEEAGEPFESGGYDRLAGQANQWVHDPDGGSFTVNTVQPVSRLNRYARVSDALGSFLKSTGNIAIILRSEALVVTLRTEQVARHLAQILASGDWSEIGFLRDDGRFLEVRRTLISEGTLEPA